MTPRRYQMDARASAKAETRAAIVQAAMQLHTQRGVMATNWADIADAAGVSMATVYRHFPSTKELIPACAQTVFAIIQPPTVEEATTIYANLTTPADRLERLVRNSCHCYAAGEGWLHAAQRERDFIPGLDDALRIIEDTLEVLIRAAVGKSVPKGPAAEIFVMCDFPFWKSLVDRGLGHRQAETTVVRLVRDRASQLA